MYTLFVLGQLMDHPMSGYQIRKALATIIGDEKTISYGALYPLLEKLEKAGDISLKIETSNRQHRQKVATITDSGRTHFQELIAAPAVLNKQTQIEFQMKVNFLHLLPLDQQLWVLRDFESYLTGKAERLSQKQATLPNNTHMVVADIVDALRVIDLRVAKNNAQITWVQNLITELKKEHN